LQKILAKSIIDNFEIRDSFPKVMWEHGVYTKEEYIKLSKRESKYWKDKGDRGFKDLIPEEIAVVRLHLSPEKWDRWNLSNIQHGVLDNDDVKRNMSDKIIANWQEHLKGERIAYTRCGDQIKYNNQNEIEWVFSPKYCWYEFPEEVRNEITTNDLS
jgi:hypothetical protein